ncbi:MAG: DUF2080 family transposase-associated protein [archaeon]
MEAIIKDAIKVGNSAGILLPKSWEGGKVKAVLIEEPLNIKWEVLRILEPYLKDIIAVFLYGSYAREEHDKKSDVDVLVVANRKIDIPKKSRFDITVITEDKTGKMRDNDPIFFYSLLREAKPIINASFLLSLKKEEPRASYFRNFIESTKRMIKMNKEFIELDKLDGELLESTSVIYSIILRLRGVFIINLILEKKEYSNTLFKNWIKNNAAGIEYDKIYNIYRAIRDKKEPEEEGKIKDVEMLLHLLEKEISKLEKK